MSDYSDMSLAELFSAADEVGDKYLSVEEIATRDQELQVALAEIEELIAE